MQVEWFKSTFSGGSDDNCVEVAFLADAVAVRDSKNKAGSVLTYTLPEWAAFLAGVKAGQFDR